MSVEKKTSIQFLPVKISNYSVSILSLKPLGNFDCPKKNVIIAFFLGLKCCYMSYMNGRIHWQSMPFNMDKTSAFHNNLP